MTVIEQAIGLRVATESEAEQRIRQERALQTMINEKKAELDRYVVFLLDKFARSLAHMFCVVAHM